MKRFFKAIHFEQNERELVFTTTVPIYSLYVTRFHQQRFMVHGCNQQAHLFRDASSGHGASDPTTDLEKMEMDFRDLEIQEIVYNAKVSRDLAGIPSRTYRNVRIKIIFQAPLSISKISMYFTVIRSVTPKKVQI